MFMDIERVSRFYLLHPGPIWSMVLICCSNPGWMDLDNSMSTLWLGCSRKKQRKFSVCFDVSNLYRNNWNKQNCFKTNWNNPKFSEKYQNMLSIKLFWLVFCFFWFNRNIEILCFGIEPKQTVSKQTKTNQNNPKFFEKIPKYALYHTVSVAFLFVLVEFKHRNSLFLYRTDTNETNVLFQIVPKLVSVPVSVVSKDTLTMIH